MEEQVTRPVPQALRPYVRAVRGYRLAGYRPGTHLGLPTATLACVFDLGEGLDLSGLALDGVRRFRSSFAGLSPSAATIHHDGSQHGIMLYLTPRGIRELFGVPAGELAGQVASAAELFGADGRRLEERLRAAPGWECLDVLLAYLGARVPDSPRENLAADVWERTTLRQGRVHVRGLADESGWSVRHLSGAVRRELGVGTRTLARLARFEASVPSIAAGLGLAAVAAECGYADQAHLTREWRELTGVTPSGWRSREEFAPATG